MTTKSLGGPLRGRLAVVTGGGGVIGKAICDVLAEKAAQVIVADINLATAEEGTFLMTKAAVQDMLAGGVTEGVVVNVSSLVAKTGWKGVCSYAASEAGIIGLTKTAALDLADKGIRCNAVLPGLTETPDQRFLTEEQKQDISSRVPLGRLAQPTEVADVVVFLCSPESSYMTGTAVEVTGGSAF
ncbi:estradiol 17-beta-dehydrogenase, putative [Ixodes scapularis]|uniref:Estradiol 17-beta-dehydrogenase, putative n=1 Tax=Ixodes scapularis TaxID=6945 RepID=B7PY26_IXOSC|nr:estradiol 17-beta-dehydrogenase, putative [Ixodes scapularis]|eukprot:XP_002402403.1 estradiol 17-beta-dehydrogenase, putative [Ixodes scapularis]